MFQLAKGTGNITELVSGITLRNGIVKHSFIDETGNLIISGGTGVYRYNFNNSTVDTLVKKSQINNGFVYYSHYDTRGRLIVSAGHRGLLARETNGTINLLISPSNISNAIVYYSLNDENSNIVLCTSQSLYIIDNDNQLYLQLNKTQLNFGEAYQTFLSNNKNLIISAGSGGLIQISEYFIKIGSFVIFGTITSGSVIRGGSYRITYSPNPNYVLDSVIINKRTDSNYIDSISRYTLRNVPNDGTILVVYKPDTSQNLHFKTPILLLQIKLII